MPWRPRKRKKGPPEGRPQTRGAGRRRPFLPRGPPRSTSGAGGLNFRVRHGTGWAPAAAAAGPRRAFANSCARRAFRGRAPGPRRPVPRAGRRRPFLPRGPPRSTSGAGGLNFRVRHGTGWAPAAAAAGPRGARGRARARRFRP